MNSVKAIIVSMAIFAAQTGFAQSSPEEKIVRQRIAEAVDLYKKGQTAESLSAFEKLDKESENNGDIQAWLGFLYLRTRQPEKAISYLEKASTSRPNDLEVLNNLGSAYVDSGKQEKAIATFTKSSELDNKQFEPFYNLGNIYLAKKEFNKAITAFLNANQRKLNTPQIINNLAVAYESSKDLNRAAACFQKASDLEPSSGLYARNAGLAYYRLQKYAMSAKYLEFALKGGITDNSVVLALGDSYAQTDRSKEAAQLYATFSTANETNPIYWYNLGVLRAKNGDKPGAEAAYRKSLALKDDDVDSLNNLGVLLFNKEDFAEARTIFEKLIGLVPNNTRIQKNFAASAARSGDMDAALPIWKNLIKVNPNDTDIRLDLANALYDAKDIEGARYHFMTILKQKPNSAEGYNGIGLCHLFGNKLVEAEAAFRSSISNNSKFAPAYNNLAITLEKMNRRKQAIQILERAAIIDPTNVDVQRNLKRMKAAG